MQKTKSTTTALYDLITGDEDARVCKDIPDESCKHQPVNFFLHLLSNFFTKLADEIASARLVFPWVLGLLGAPMLLVSLAVPIRESGVLLPQLFIAAKIRAKALRKYVWMFGGLLSGFALWACGFALMLDLQAEKASWLIFAALLVFSFARGICSVAAKDVLGKTVSKSRRGTLMGLATSVSGIFTLLLGLNLGFYNQIKNNEVILASLFGIAGLCWIVASGAIWAIREEPGATAGGGNAGIEALKSLRLLKDDKPFRNFVIVRTLLLSVSLGAPMLIILAQNALGNAALIGLFLIVSGLANTVSGYLWGRLADYSSRSLMAIASGINALAGVAVLLILQIEADINALVLFVTAYFTASVCLAGVRLGRKTLLVDMATAENRSAYVAVSNTAIGFLILIVGAVVSLAAGQNTHAMLWAFSGLSALACVLSPILLPAQRA
ncbi:MAG: MFS transporter [Pseudomonadota bacterium]